LDSLSDFDGISINFPRYIYPGTNGYGSALSFNRIIGQFVQIWRYRNLANTSFTFEMCIYCTNLSMDDYTMIQYIL
jgi:hypothetical protein